MFARSSYLSISGGTFTNINPPTRDAGPCSSRNSDGLMIVQDDEVDLQKELISGNRYRIHSASYGGRFVAVKTFEGPHAKQDLAVAMALPRKAFHPNILKIVGVSDANSESHFVLFHGITSEQKMQSLIAKALRTDLNTSVQLSIKAVKGIAAGLSCLESRNILKHAGRVNFDIFIGHENEPIISFHPSNTTHDDGPLSQNFDIETGGRGIKVLNRLCQQLFSGANSILYDDSPERNFDAYNREGRPAATLEDVEGTSNLSESEATLNLSSSTEKSKSSTTPRREVWWLDLGATNQCLQLIKQRFEDYLDRSLISSSNSLLRRIRSPKGNILKQDMHQCPGYLREEITLTSDVSRSAIVSHVFPSESELCSICGQLVQYAYSHPSITGAEIEWGEDGPPDLPVFDDEGEGDMDSTGSPSAPLLSSALSDSPDEPNHEQADESAEAIARRLAITNNILAVEKTANVFQNLRKESENAIERKTNSASGSSTSSTYHADYRHTSPPAIQNGDSYPKLPITLPGVKQWLNKNSKKKTLSLYREEAENATEPEMDSVSGSSTYHADYSHVFPSAIQDGDMTLPEVKRWLSKNSRKKTLSPGPSGTSATFFPPPTTDIQPTIISNKKPSLSDIVGRKENEPIAECEGVNSASGQKGPAKFSNFSLKNTGSGTMANNNVGNIINSTILDVGNDYSYIQAGRKLDLIKYSDITLKCTVPSYHFTHLASG